MRAFSSHQPRPPTGSNPPVRKATLAKRAPERWASCCCSRIRSEVNRLRFTQTCRRNIQFQSGPARVEPVEGRSQHRCGRQLSHPAEMLRMPARSCWARGRAMWARPAQAVPTVQTTRRQASPRAADALWPDTTTVIWPPSALCRWPSTAPSAPRSNDAPLGGAPPDDHRLRTRASRS